MRLLRSGLLRGQAIGRVEEFQCLRRVLLHSGQPMQQPWQPYQSRRTFSDTTATKSPTTPTTGAAAAGNTPSLSDQVRLLMRRVPYPVAIITATDPNSNTSSNSTNLTEKPSSFRGMTVSSFSTVTLNPTPVISFNVKRPSETLNALISSGRFLVHLLASAKEPAALARDFSKGNANVSIVGGEKEGGFEYAALSPTAAEDGNNNPLPLLRRKGIADSTVDFPFVFECRVHLQSMEVFDHTIVLGHVVRAIAHGDVLEPQTPGSCSESELCLTYADTRFWEMGHEIKG